MDVLLLQDQDEVRERIVFALESKYGARVHEAKSVTRALELLKEFPRMDFLVYDYMAADPSVFQSLWTACASVPCILFAQKTGASKGIPKEIRIVAEIPRDNMVDGLVAAVETLVGGGELAFVRPEDGYCRIRTKLLLSVSPLGADIYIKLSEAHYVKLFQTGDEFKREDLERYTTQKGVEYLFLKHENTGAFVEKYRRELQSFITGPVNQLDRVTGVANELHETAQSLIRSLGFTPEVQELARAQTELTKKALGRSPRLSELWDRLKQSKGKYLHLHSTLCSFYAAALASKLEWASDTTYQKLALASFLHDITLSNNELAKISSLTELEAKKAAFSEREFREYKFHPMAAAEISKQMSQVLPDVDTILMQHHELPDSTGFPRALSHTYIHPLAAVFIVTHHLVDQLIQSPMPMSDYAAAYAEKFPGSHFRKIFRAIAAG